MHALRLLTRFSKDQAARYTLWFLAGTFFLTLTNWLAVQIPLEVGQAVNLMNLPDFSPQALKRPALLILGIGAALILVRTLSRLFFFTPGRYIEANLRNSVFAHLVHLEEAFYATHSPGELVSELTQNITAVRALAGYATLQAINVVTGIGLATSRMLRIDFAITLTAILPMLLLFLFMQRGLRQIFDYMKQSQIDLAALSNQVLGSYNGIATIRAFDASETFTRHFRDHNERYVKTSLAMARLRAILMPLLPLVGSIGVFVLLYFGGNLIAANRLSVGELAQMIGLIAVMLPPLMSLSWLLNIVDRGIAALSRLYEILDTPIPLHPQLDKKEPPRAAPLLEVRHLSFTYSQNGDPRMVLNDISFELREGQVIGLFGRTGSGKSTLLKLLTRLLPPSPGSILIKGKDALDFSLKPYRENFAVVPERPFLFSETVAQNIEMGASEPLSDKELDDLIEKSALTGDIAAFRDGVKTVIGPRGLTLSGGQRQRVTLARALASQAPILLLDDVLASVDAITEETLIDHLYQEGRATLLVSNRVSALKHADLILVLDEGKIVARGTHAFLLDHNEFYRSIATREKRP